MTDDQYTKLFKYMQQRFDEVNQRFETVDARFDQVISTLDEVLKNQETDDHERLAMNHQLDQHEEWIERASSQLNIKYDRAG